MIRRVLFALLVACLALPALAAPEHCAPPSNHHAMQGGHHAPENPAPVDQGKAIHGCIGCAAPAGIATRLEPPPSPAIAITVPATALALPNTSDGPDTPPPRS